MTAPLCALCAIRTATLEVPLDGRWLRACAPCVLDPVPDPRPVRMSERVLRIVRRHPGINLFQLSEIIDESPRGRDTIASSLQRLMRSGKITAQGIGYDRTFHPAQEQRHGQQERGTTPHQG